MEFKINLKNIELLGERFEKKINPFDVVKEELNVNMKSEIRVGIFSCGEEVKEEGVAIEYIINIKQNIKDSDKEISKLFIKYIMLFEDEECNLVKTIKEKKLNEDEFKSLVINMNKLAYPYIKEYVETKYNKANLVMKLPLEIEVV